MNMYRAVLFDFDGVLSDTHGDNYGAWVEAFAQHDLAIEEEEYALLEGKRSCEMVPHFLRKNGVDEKLAAEIIEYKNAHYARNGVLNLYPGVEELILMLKAAKLKIAVVSGGSSQRLRTSASLEMLKLFDVVITGEDCSESKPSPQPYLLAAQALSVNPVECLVVENAPLGIESAKRAGMDCVAICSTLKESHLVKAGLVLQSVGELSTYLIISNFDDRGAVLQLKTGINKKG